MGLDSVELLIDIENAFQISISDQEAENTGTVGELYNLIINKIDYSKHNKCNSQVMFYKLRQVLSYHCQFDKNKITPKTKLEDLFDEKSIKLKWKNIQDELYFNISDLQRSRSLKLGLRIISIIGVIISIILFSDLFIDSNMNMKITSFLIILFIYVLWRVTIPFKSYPKFVTVGEWITGILPINIKIIDLSIQDKNDVLSVLKFIINDKAGVPIKDIKLDSHIVYDLGIN